MNMMYFIEAIALIETYNSKIDFIKTHTTMIQLKVKKYESI